MSYAGTIDRANPTRERQDYEARIVAECNQEFSQLQVYRAVFAEQWDEVAQLADPPSRNTFYYGNYNFPGLKKSDRQVDASAMQALDRFASILDSLLTPRNMTWHMLGSESDYVMKNRDARLWFEQATRAVFKYRYAPIGNFSAQNQNIYKHLGAYGTGNMFVDQATNEAGVPVQGLRYKSIPLGQMFLRENHQNLINGFCRWYRMTGQQAMDAFGDKCPARLKEQALKSSQMPYDFLHRVCPRNDYDPRRLDTKGKPYASYNICLTTNEFISEGGYNQFPLASSRYIQRPGEVYGFGALMAVLPSMKTLNAQKRDFLTQGHRAASPVYLVEDDGIMSWNFRPDAINSGGMRDGKPTVGILPTGEIQVSKEMMAEEKAIIDGACLVDLFKILLSDPKVFSATQVVEMISQRGILIAPVVGRQQSEYLGPMIVRELALLEDMRLLPPMPRIIQEARGSGQIMYTSPLARDMRASEVAGFNRTLETALSVVNATQDPAPLDRFAFDRIIPAVAKINGMPESWTASDQEVAQKQQVRQQAAEQQAKIQAMPAQAAMMKAKAASGGRGGLPPEAQVQAPLPAPGAQ
jgi:hypothetical protein